MSNSVTDNTVTINIMDRELKIKCPKDKVAELQEAATYLDNKMREIHHSNKLITIDRVAITAALNIAHELIIEKQNPQVNIGDLNKRLLDLKNKLCQPLTNNV
jgi:cell division protein ZapA